MYPLMNIFVSKESKLQGPKPHVLGCSAAWRHASCPAPPLSYSKRWACAYSVGARPSFLQSLCSVSFRDIFLLQ